MTGARLLTLSPPANPNRKEIFNHISIPKDRCQSLFHRVWIVYRLPHITKETIKKNTIIQRFYKSLEEQTKCIMIIDDWNAYLDDKKKYAEANT